MQSSPANFGEDAALAAQILLKMSGYKANADAKALAGNNLSQNNLQSNAVNNPVMPEPSLNNAKNLNTTAQPQQAQTPSLNNPQNLNAVNTQLPPADTDTLLANNQNASMTQTMQINPNGQTDMNQSMIPPVNSQAVA